MKNSRPKHVLKQGHLAMRVCTAGIPFDKENPDPPPMVCHPHAKPLDERRFDGWRPFHCPHCLIDFSTMDPTKAEEKNIATDADDVEDRLGDALQQRARVP